MEKKKKNKKGTPKAFDHKVYERKIPIKKGISPTTELSIKERLKKKGIKIYI